MFSLVFFFVEMHMGGVRIVGCGNENMTFLIFNFVLNCKYKYSYFQGLNYEQHL